MTGEEGSPDCKSPSNPDTWERPGPDYRFTGSVYQAKPQKDGTAEITFYWELTYMPVGMIGAPIPNYSGQPY